LAVLLPMALAAAEFLYPLLFQSYTGVAMMPLRPLIQVADLGGPLLLSALQATVNGALADSLLWQTRHAARSPSASLIGASIALAAMVQGGLKRRPDPVAWVPVGLAGVMTAVVLFSSPLITPYPNWNETTVLMDDYLRHVDTCTEDGEPPLAPPDHDARAAFVNPTGLLDYSVTAYIAIKFPNVRPC